MRYATLHGSNGESRFDLDTGIVEYPYGAEAPRFVRVDTYEYELAWGHAIERGDSCDVLDLAGWDENGEWIEAEEAWRDEWISNYMAESHEDELSGTGKLGEDILHYLTFGRDATIRYNAKMPVARRRARYAVEFGVGGAA